MSDKITLEKKAIVLQAIKAGLTLRDACNKASIPYLPLVHTRHFLKIDDEEESNLYIELRIDLNLLNITHPIHF